MIVSTHSHRHFAAAVADSAGEGDGGRLFFASFRHRGVVGWTPSGPEVGRHNNNNTAAASSAVVAVPYREGAERS